MIIIATLGIITRRKDEVLLGIRKDDKDKLSAPGGEIAPGESLPECLTRWTRRNVGIELNPEKLQKVAAIITFYAGGAPDLEVHVYRTSDFFGVPHETESMVPHWYNIDEARKIVIRDSGPSCAWLSQLLCGGEFRADVYHRERTEESFIRTEFSPLRIQ
jgi:ADP-ribose pyrophosphatase YjhB (NUDIX family)